AEALNAAQWGFAVVFDCQSQQSSRNIATAVGNVKLTAYSCGTRDGGFFVAVADYPARSITAKSIDAAYTGAVTGAASNIKGKIRRVTPYKLGKITGRDALIDVKENNQTAHLRVFYVRNRQFQITFIGPKGRENSKASLAFLNSFALK
ncbi:MAG TPA: hypothetical protein VGC27_00115, partial [Rhizomicrobium sp.]